MIDTGVGDTRFERQLNPIFALEKEVRKKNGLRQLERNTTLVTHAPVTVGLAFPGQEGFVGNWWPTNAAYDQTLQQIKYSDRIERKCEMRSW